MESEIQELVKKDREQEKQCDEADKAFSMNQKEEFIRQLQQQNEILMKKNKELMDKLFIQLSEGASSFQLKDLLTDITAPPYLYEQDLQKVDQLKDLIKEVLHTHLEEAKKAELDKGRSIIDIDGIINKNREDTGWKKRDKLLQLKKVLEKETETWRKLVSLVKTEKQAKQAKDTVAMHSTDQIGLCSWDNLSSQHMISDSLLLYQIFKLVGSLLHI